MYDQIQLFFDSLLTKHQCLISIIDKMKKINYYYYNIIIIIIIIILIIIIIIIITVIIIITFINITKLVS